MLEQIICNCLLNAIQANATEVEILVNIKQTQVQIHINDNGQGFSETELAFPFVPFRTSKANGLGLGLVLCQRLIQQAGGEIRLANNEPQGASVRLNLPFSGEKRVNSFSG